MKPTDASPETKEQLETHVSPNLYQGVKTPSPPNCKTSLGLVLPQKFLNNILTIRINVASPENQIKTISLNLNL